MLNNILKTSEKYDDIWNEILHFLCNDEELIYCNLACKNNKEDDEIIIQFKNKDVYRIPFSRKIYNSNTPLKMFDFVYKSIKITNKRK
jgi:type IV secretory pathway component VirB8